MRECMTCGTKVASGWLYQGSDFYCMNNCIKSVIGEEVFRPLWQKYHDMTEDPNELTWCLLQE